jgi:hypothetical protein
MSVVAQNKQTDREFDGIKGSVKSVITERADVKKSSGVLVESNRRSESEFEYDKSGNSLARKYYEYREGGLREAIVYKTIDGDKVSIEEDVETPGKITASSPIQNTKNAKSFDPRYSFKYKYKYDLKGNISEEAWYQSDGSLWMRYVYSTKEKEKEELVYDEDGNLNQKSVRNFDDKNNEVELIYYDTENNKVIGKETFEYIEFDAKGNWTKRITYEGDEESKFVMQPREVTYRTISYF